MLRTLTIVTGLSGSGKTTWSRAQQARLPFLAVVDDPSVDISQWENIDINTEPPRLQRVPGLNVYDIQSNAEFEQFVADLSGRGHYVRIPIGDKNGWSTQEKESHNPNNPEVELVPLSGHAHRFKIR